ncbi:MAG TPA: GtrA family protein, partial [Dehalococcoidia bacterium]|nr:GtrA family protein [Dehalococcoidia bacterium]
MASQPALRTASSIRRSPPEAKLKARWSASGGPERLVVALLAETARPLRFVLVGGLCALLQLALLVLLTGAGCPPLPANTLAYLLSAQVNFVLSD